jgi:type II secretion system protein C
MDVATRLADWRERPPEQWLTTVNRYLPPGVTAVLVIAIAYQLATLTWTFVPGATPTGAPAAQRSNGADNQASRDLSVLTDSHLFGEADQQAAPVAAAVVDAPDTTLSLVLKGILSVDEDPNGGAIIQSNRGEDRAYRAGQTIEARDGTTLHSVYADRAARPQRPPRDTPFAEELSRDCLPR